MSERDRQVLPQYMFRDPLEVVISKESQSCKGCAHLATFNVLGVSRKVCRKGKKAGRRCDQYRENEVA